MQQIYRTVFGSRLYGTDLPTSDFDYKGVFLPSAEQILMNEIPRTHTAAAEDESYSLARYLDLLAQGQTVALDMLFAPPDKWTQMDPIWYDVLQNKGKILNRKCGAAVGYARAQAEKYSLKGARMTALEEALAVIRAWPKQGDALQDALFANGAHLFGQQPPHVQQYLRLTDIDAESGIRFLEICGKKVGLTSTCKFADMVLTKQLAEYGDRAAEAKAASADWKALYHAVRVTEQTKELLETGEITLPRPNAGELLEIRMGLVPVAAVFDRVERGIAEVLAAQAVSELDAEPDRSWMRAFILDCHKEVVANG